MAQITSYILLFSVSRTMGKQKKDADGKNL